MEEENQPILKFAKLQEDTIIPSKKDDDAGYDIYANFPEDFMIIKEGETKLIPTKLGCMVPKGYYLQFFDRGSTGSKGIHTHCGVIDSNFRGEIFVALCNTLKGTNIIIKKKNLAVPNETLIKMLQEKDNKPYMIYPYDKAIVQGILFKLPNAKVLEISKEELENDKTDRGKGMLGSSNK